MKRRPGIFRRWLLLTPILCLWTAVAVGCTAHGGAARNGDEATEAPARRGRVGLVPKVQAPIADVPVPVGFQLVESISRHYTVGDQRFIDHTYEGRENKFDVDRFYRERMPLKDWRSEGNQMVRGTFEQRYRKNNEIAEITIDSERNAFGMERTRVAITIRPDPDGPNGDSGAGSADAPD